MLEETSPTGKMETLVQNRSLEPKGKQDAVGRFTRGVGVVRRREGGTPVTRSDALPKPWQQQRRFDRKPATRNALSVSNASYGNWREVANVNGGKYGSTSCHTGKKPNLNHLLNFKYEKYETAYSPHMSRSRGSIWTTQKHKYNKEQFVQANCQFIVQEGHDYSVHTADPDLLVDWEWVEQVRVAGNEVSSCPICLCPPVAGKITRCGHIYCWSCILHYLSLTDNTWRKCPICYEAVHHKDLKSVVALARPDYSLGDKITMQLMRRDHGSVVALPIDQWKENNSEPIQLGDDSIACYPKLLLASSEQILKDVIMREEVELNVNLKQNRDSPEVCFIESALVLLIERKSKLLGGVSKTALPAPAPPSPSETLETETDVSNDYIRAASVRTISYSSAFSDEEAEEELNSKDCNIETAVITNSNDTAVAAMKELEEAVHCLNVTDNRKQGWQRRGSPHYFYQAAGGQHVYLQTLNTHMLEKEYGSLALCPSKITAEIVEKEWITMNEPLRKRLRHLSHLPVTCEFVLVELKLTPPLVSLETLDVFAADLQKRSSRRNRKAHEEKRHERKLKAIEDRRSGKYPGMRFQVDSLEHFPEYSNPDVVPNDVESVVATSTVSSPAKEASKEGSNCPMSFAQMLREGKSKPNVVEATTGSSGKDVFHGNDDSDAGADGEDHVSLTRFRDAFGVALQSALDNVTLSVEGKGKKSKKSHKQKGKKHHLVFSTFVRRD